MINSKRQAIVPHLRLLYIYLEFFKIKHEDITTGEIKTILNTMLKDYLDGALEIVDLSGVCGSLLTALQALPIQQKDPSLQLKLKQIQQLELEITKCIKDENWSEIGEQFKTIFDEHLTHHQEN